MDKRRQTGWTFVLAAVAFAVIGSSTEVASPVVWFLLAGVFAVVGVDQLRRSRAS